MGGTNGEDLQYGVNLTQGRFSSHRFRANVIEICQGVPCDPAFAWPLITLVDDRLAFIRSGLAIQENIKKDIRIQQYAHRECLVSRNSRRGSDESTPSCH